MVLELRVDRIAGGAWLIVHDQPLLAEQPVDQARFPDIGTAHDIDMDDIVLSRFGRSWQLRRDFVEQVTAVLSDGARNRKRLAQAELVKPELPRLIGEVI